MKRFTKLLAMGMAMALTFGMTVSASGTNVTNPSASTLGEATSVATGGTVGSISNDEEKQAVASAAASQLSGTTLLNNAVGAGGQVHATLVEVFSLSVSDSAKPAKVTFKVEVSYEIEKEYGYGWGYALMLVVNTNTRAAESPEVIPMERNADGSFSANVKKGGNYAVVKWTRATSTTGAEHGLTVNTGRLRPTYQEEHTAARTAIEVNGYGTSAAEYYNSQYVFAKTMGSVVIKLDKDSNVQFGNLEDLEYGQAYLVLCYNDVQDISGAPDRHFSMTKVGDKAYTANLPKGEYVAVVIKVTTDTTKVTPQPAIVAPTPSTTVVGGAVGGATAAGILSPKTGEVLSLAVILAAICLAGAAVCAKKARGNA